MPIQSCSSDGKPGFKWGEQGSCYTYTSGDDTSISAAKKKVLAQALAIGDIGKNSDSLSEQDIEYAIKSLKDWFKEKWVDISRPKAGGGFEPCGRADASSGKYPKCVPAARAARMTPEQIASAVRRKRTAESTQSREDKKPINVSTDVEKATENIPTNPALYARVKAEAKAKFDVYPSAYANAWLVREYKKRGGGYRTISKSFDLVNKIADDLAEEEAVLADALIAIAQMYGKFNEDETGIWAGYESADENEVKDIGVKCSNCVLYEGNGICKVIAQQVEDEGKCRFAVIPDGVVQMESADLNNGDKMDDGEEMINGYPAATQDIIVNIKNRQYCIDVAGYGPMNPAISNPEFWQQKADIFKTTPEEAKTALCGNCAAFIQTTDMRTAIAAGLGGEDEAYAVINLANLGYCEIFDFKCAASRTCDAWVVGGPVNDSNADMSKTYVNVRKIQYMNPLS